MGYSTDKMLPVKSTPSGQSNLVSVEYTCIRLHKVSMKYSCWTQCPNVLFGLVGIILEILRYNNFSIFINMANYLQTLKGISEN